MHVLVTGASGFIGQVLVRRLLAAGHQVSALVRPGTPAGPVPVVEHALGSGRALVLPAGVEAVAHLAQSRAYRQFPGDAAEMFAVNVAGTQEVLAAAAAAKVAGFCLISTGTVYEPFAVPMLEDAALAPRGYLGASKLAAEVLAGAYAGLFPLSVLRLFAPYGPHQTDRLMPDLIRRVRGGLAVTLPESGEGMRFTPTHVDDICDVILTALVERWVGTLNVAAPGSVSVGAVAATIGRALGKPVLLERRAMGAPVLVPELGRLAARYDLARFRDVEAGIAAVLAAEGG